MRENADASCCETEISGSVIVIPARALLRFDPAGPSDGCPVRDFVGEVLSELLGVMGMTVSASPLNFSCTSRDASSLLISWFSFVVMFSGRPAGPTMPYQVRPLKPASRAP